MIHFGKTLQGELELRMSGEDVETLYRAISGGGLQERRDMYDIKTYIEKEFSDEIKKHKKII